MRIHHSKIDPISRKRAILINICTINLKSTVSIQEVRHLQVNTVSWLDQQIIARCLHNWVPAESFPQSLRRPLKFVPCHSMLTLQVLLRHKSFSTSQVSSKPVRKPLIWIYSSAAFAGTSDSQ